MRAVVWSVVVAGLLPASARAATFAENGEFRFDQAAAISLDFEDPSLEIGAGTIQEDAGALSGSRILRLAPFAGAGLPLELPPSSTLYRVSAWLRDGEAVASVDVTYADNPHAGVDEIAVLYPTGRMTSDGWYEVASDHVRIDGARGATVNVGFFAPSGASVDAVELVPVRELAPDEHSGQACEGSVDPVCGESGVCLFSQCRYVGGTVPNLPPDREQVSLYLKNRLRLMFGPLLNRTLDLPHAELALQQLDTAESPWRDWNSFTLALRRLHDGHTTTSSITDFVLENERPLGLCFIEGDADLSTGAAPSDDVYLDVLVSHTAGSRTLGLVPGDRLVSVDGVHPIEWARAQVEHHWAMNPTSNHTTYAELAEQLRGLIARYAHTIEVVRCDAVSSQCGEIESIDLSLLPTLTPEEQFSSVQCDNRPLRHLPDSPANHAPASFDTVYFGRLNESTEAEGIYGAEWDSLSTSGVDGVAPGLNAAVQLFKNEANGVILDHRTGNGGTILGPQILWKFAVPSRPVSVYQDRRYFDEEQPSLTEGLALFQAGLAANQADIAGSANPTTMPVALLLTRDVSASDWLPLGLKDAAPNVKLFAPFQTNGGFSTRYSFGYWLGVNFVMAVGDTYDVTGTTRNGRGVEPDFVVRPKQSDLLVGKDTVYEAALAWVRQELAP